MTLSVSPEAVERLIVDLAAAGYLIEKSIQTARAVLSKLRRGDISEEQLWILELEVDHDIEILLPCGVTDRTRISSPAGARIGSQVNTLDWSSTVGVVECGSRGQPDHYVAGLTEEVVT